MTALSGLRRRRTLSMLAATVAVVVLGVVLVFTGVDALRHYTAAKRADAGLPVQPVPDTPTAMFATVDGADALTSVSVFVLAPALTGGSIITVPVDVDATQGIGPERNTLANAYAHDGPTGLVQAVESALSVSVDWFAVDTPDKAAALLDPLAPLAVDLPRTVVGDAGGKTTVVFNRGQRSMTAAEAVQVLTARSATVDETARTPNVEAVWTAVAASVGAGRTTPAPSPTVGSFDDLVSHLFAGKVGARGLPLGTFAPGTPGIDGKDVVLLDRAEEVMVFASVAPGAMSRPGDGLAIRIVAPPGSEAKVKQTIAVLLYLGDNIASVDLTGTAHDKTVVYVYDESARVSTDSLKSVLGEFSYGSPTTQPDGVDATIELGNAFLSDANPVSTPVTTSTTIAGGDPAATEG